MLDLQHNDLLRGLTPPELELVLPCLERRTFAAGETIIRSGEPGDCLHVVEFGQVAVTRPERGGVGTTVAQLGPGQIFGEMSLLTGQPRSAEVTALVPTVTQAVNVSAFFQVAGRAPTLLLNIGRVLASRLGQYMRATNQRERRLLTVLVGPVPTLVGSVVATNLAGALAAVSGRRAMLVDAPVDRAARLPGREDAPDLGQVRSGDETFAHLTRLQVGPVALHVSTFVDPGVAQAPPLDQIVRAISRLTRIVDLPIINLVGAPPDLIDLVLPLAQRVLVLAGSNQIRSEVPPLVKTCQALAPAETPVGVLVLSGDGSAPKAVRARVQQEVGLPECVVLPGQADLLREAALVQAPFTIFASRSATSQTLWRLAREIAGLRVGLALGSGAARGVAHVGVLAALSKLGVPLDTVTGTSIGALVGAGAALGMNMGQVEETMSRLVDLWGEALRPVIPRFALVSSRGLDRIVEELAGDVSIEELSVPYGAVATDLNSGRAVYLRWGSLARAVRASISIPLIFPAVSIGPYMLVDGFVSNPVPTQLARLLGADLIVASNLSRPVEESEQGPLELTADPHEGNGRQSNILETYLRCAEVMMAGRGEHDCLSADLTLRPRLPSMSWREFQRGGAPLRAGEIAVEESLDSLRELLPWLRLRLS